MTNYLIYGRPSMALADVCAQVPGALIPSRAIESVRASRVGGWVVGGDLGAEARLLHAVEQRQTAITGINGFIAKRSTTVQPAAGGAPPRGRPV